MNEPPRTLQLVTSEPAGYCDPESGVCHVPAGQPTDRGADREGPPAAAARRDGSNPVR
jgi:hypothetical protein